MIKFFDTVPTIYPKTSRDFQFLGRLIDVVLNDVKHNVDGLYNLPSNTNNPKLTELLASTLGFKAKRNYDQAQLVTIIKILPLIIKYKGSKRALEIICEAILHTTGTFGVTRVVTKKPNQVTITLPEELKDTTLLVDLLPYILPAGMTYRIEHKTEGGSKSTLDVVYGDFAISEWQPDIALSELFDVSKIGTSANGELWPYYSNYIGPEHDKELNPGTLYNGLTPALHDNQVWTPNGDKWTAKPTTSTTTEEEET